ncbi:MAG: alkaline phosphatase PhoX [Allosphingosinicella sp.]
MLDRRQFSGALLAGLAFSGLAGCAGAAGASGYRNQAAGYGPLVRDPAGVFDLPQGFSYRILSATGDRMSDGFFVPDRADGMGCFGLPDGRIALVRNHELKPHHHATGPTGGRPELEERLRAVAGYSRDEEGRTLPGGTTTIVLDAAAARVERQYLSLAGTAVNCAGGPTPWGSWLSCEETVLTRADGLSRDHGWVFEVPAAGGVAAPVPLTAMGRFKHEAAAVDPRTGIVYLTEDQEDGLFYRFLPERKGALARGGRLQALAWVRGGADSRNWDGIGFVPGSWADVRWVDLENVESPEDDLRHRGHAKGGALFARGEGIHRGDGEFFFCCTSGGAAKIGQVMRYVPSPREGTPDEAAEPGRLQLFVESTSSAVLEYGDNLTVAPWGHLIVCEDRGGVPQANYLRGITPDGRLYTLGRHPGSTELAGACFSPDGKTLFLNLYSPGRTLAITGPWASFRG